MINFYSIFHANLNFSVIPKSHFPLIIDNCYWPLIELAEKYPLKFGIEFPATTLMQIDKIDHEFIEKVKELVQEKKIEIIGSGYTQLIGPLVPSEVNHDNISFGIEIYKKILNFVPKIYYVNEQAFSEGLISIYKDHGVKAIIVDWQNTVKHQNLDDELRYSAQIAFDGEGNEIPVIWNDSINFQKLQRYLYGNYSIDNIVDYYFKFFSKEEDRNILLYGSDWEIFESRPGEIDLEYSNLQSNREFLKFEKLIEVFLNKKEVKFILPSELLNDLSSANKIRLSTAECPIPVKKQDKYNILRWAVSGRDDVLGNTKCHQIFQNIIHIESLYEFFDNQLNEHKIDRHQMRLQLLDNWSSDFRTHATEEKFHDFLNYTGALMFQSQKLKNTIIESLRSDKGDFQLFNPLNYDWKYYPYTLSINFNKGYIKYICKLILNDTEYLVQLENVKYYKDHSIRSCDILFQPYLKAKANYFVTFVTEKIDQKSNFSFENNELITDQVKIQLSSYNGGSIERLIFPKISEKWVLGKIEHGWFKHISLSPDWFTGHSIIRDREGSKETDLGSVTKEVFETGSWNIRVPIHYKTNFENGELWKTFFVYRDLPLIDIKFHYRFPKLFPNSFRWGILTFNPTYFDKEHLKYSTKNGGDQIETFDINNKSILQDMPLDMKYTATTGIGATESWITFSDNQSSITTTSPKTKLYSIPMIHYEELKGQSYLRLYNTISEHDDTNLAVWKGHFKMETQIFSEKGTPFEGPKMAKARDMGLIFIPNSDSLRLK